MDTIQIDALFGSIERSNMTAFKELAEEITEIARAESGTLQYDWFLSDDNISCVFRETYADSESVMTHLRNCKDLMGPIVELGGDVEVGIFGRLTAELAEAMAVMTPKIYQYVGGKGGRWSND